VYGFGATLYFALTSSAPEDARWRKLRGIEVDVADHNPAVPSHIAHALKRALAIDPRERCQTAAELQQLLMGEEMAQTWKEELEAAIDRTNLEVFGEEDVRQEPHARLVALSLLTEIHLQDSCMSNPVFTTRGSNRPTSCLCIHRSGC
jgi:hypothetical protein